MDRWDLAVEIVESLDAFIKEEVPRQELVEITYKQINEHIEKY
ncbi:hypothetical protein [Bacillus paranthracis]|nr:hypothetical protein [Bacillus paranthracis]